MAKRGKNIGADDFDDDLSMLDEVNELNKDKKIIQNYIRNDLKLIAKNESQKELIKSIKNNEITICTGLAGTGKTFISLAYGLNLLRKATNKYRKLYLVKSVLTLKEEEVGFLKGTLEDKINPFMQSYYINIEKLVLKNTLYSLITNDIIKPFPLAYMRGVSLDNAIIIIDEAQNISLDNIRTAMTRIGSDSKLVILGDLNQIDMKYKENSSLEIILNMFEDVESIGIVKMDENDTNVRNPLISIIENKFKNYFNNAQKKNGY